MTVDGFAMQFGRFTTQRCDAIVDAERCRDFSYECMQGPSHGLIDPASAKREYDDVSAFVYYGGYLSGCDQLVGVYRAQPDCNVSRFPNLNPKIHKFHDDGRRLCDIGSYTSLPFGEGLELFQGLFIVCMADMLRAGITGIYIQAREERVRFFKRLGFSVVGAPFKVQGWTPVWHPMLMEIPALLAHYQERSFQQAWRQDNGEPLWLSFWNAVAPVIRARCALTADAGPDAPSALGSRRRGADMQEDALCA